MDLKCFNSLASPLDIFILYSYVTKPILTLLRQFLFVAMVFSHNFSGSAILQVYKVWKSLFYLWLLTACQQTAAWAGASSQICF